MSQREAEKDEMGKKKTSIKDSAEARSVCGVEREKTCYPISKTYRTFRRLPDSLLATGIEICDSVQFQRHSRTTSPLNELMRWPTLSISSILPRPGSRVTSKPGIVWQRASGTNGVCDRILAFSGAYVGILLHLPSALPGRLVGKINDSD
jgi:hypothetical protein